MEGQKVRNKESYLIMIECHIKGVITGIKRIMSKVRQ